MYEITQKKDAEHAPHPHTEQTNGRKKVDTWSHSMLNKPPVGPLAIAPVRRVAFTDPPRAKLVCCLHICCYGTGAQLPMLVEGVVPIKGATTIAHNRG